MANNKTSIEVEAKGEFSQLTRGLREVKGALSDVTNIVNKGAKSGGIFGDNDVRALDIFTRRFEDSMNRMSKLMDQQGQKLEQLYSRRRNASNSDIAAIDKEIKKHGQYLDALEQERQELEDLMRLRQQESQGFNKPGGSSGGGSGGSSGGGGSVGGGRGTQINGFSSAAISQLAQMLNSYQTRQNSPIVQEQTQRYRDQQSAMDRGYGGGSDSGGSDSGSSTSSGSSAATGGMLSALGGGLKSVGGLIASVAGISLGISQLLKWEQMAEQREISWQDTLQRTGINRSGAENTGLNYGYNTYQTQQAVDVYSQQAGYTSLNDISRMGAFSRGYGVDLNTTAGIAGQFAQLGYGSPGTSLQNLAGVADSSGMTPRILEVMETGLGFLQSMDHSLKDNSGNNLLAYTARINQIGQEDGAQKLTGASGANLLQQMGSNIFNPNNTTWQAMGMTLLSKYGGQNIQSMDAFGRMEQWQKGFQDPENMKVLGQYLADATKGMNAQQATEFKTLTLQNAMGGNTTLQQAQQFGEMTNWLQKFNPSDPNMKKLLAGGNAAGNTSGVGSSGNIDGRAQQWNTTLAAKIEITNARWMNAQIAAGELLIPVKLQVEQGATNLLNGVTQQGNNATGGQGLNWQQAAMIGGALLLGPRILKGMGKGGSSILKRVFGIGGKKAAGTAAEEATGPAAEETATHTAETAGAHAEESALYRWVRGAGGSLVKGVSKIPGVGNMMRSTALAHGIMNETSPLYRNTIGAGVKLLGGAGHSLIRATSNVIGRAPGMLGMGLKGLGRGAANVIGKIPIIGGVADTLINHYAFGDSWGRSAAGGAGGIVGGIAGSLLDPFIGPLGTIGGAAAGNWLGGKAYDLTSGLFSKPSDAKAKQDQTKYLKDLSDKGVLTLDNLDTNGVKELAALNKDGNIKINGMKDLSVQQIADLNKQGKLEITSLNTKGASALVDLQNKGEVAIGQFSKSAVTVITDASNKQVLDVHALNTQGQKQLQDLQSQGLIKIGKLQSDGTQQITVLNKDGAKALADLQSKGEINLSSMDKTTNDKLDHISTTHDDLAKSMKKSTSSGWDNLTSSMSDWWNSFLDFMHIPHGNDGKASGNADTTKGANALINDVGKGTSATKNNIHDSLASIGLNNSAIAGIMGNLQVESGFSTNALNKKSGAYGLGQWLGDRKTGLYKYANDHHLSVDSQEAQIGWLLQEIQSGQYGSIKAMNGMTPAQAAAYFEKNFEISGGSALSTRMSDANQLASYGYASGAWISKNQVARLHAGEEVIGQATTAETMRKTGKRPSQILSAVLGDSSSKAGATSKDINININLSADDNTAQLPTADIVNMIRQVIQQETFKSQIRNVFA